MIDGKSKSNQAPHRLFTSDEVAEQLNVSPEQIRALIRGGQLAAVNVGSGKKRSLYRISPEALKDFLRHRRKPWLGVVFHRGREGWASTFLLGLPWGTSLDIPPRRNGTAIPLRRLRKRFFGLIPEPRAVIAQSQQVIFAKSTSASLRTRPTEPKSTATPAKPRNF